MITFLICLTLLVAAYFVYGKYLEKVCGISMVHKVPSESKFDGVDYVPMPMWKTFFIQLLNIAGLGPIFGAVSGAAYGPVAFLWITFGGILFGAMHDFVAGVMSLREGGMSLPDIIKRYLGRGMGWFNLVFTVGLMVLVGAVFMSQPAALMAGWLPESASAWLNEMTGGATINGFSTPIICMMAIILVYYVVATLFPVDKIIGKIYPVFGFALVAMAVGILGVLLFAGKYTIPELDFVNHIADPSKFPIFPTLFITIACGAISGFHATQSPIMARCLTNEKECRPVFYGAMISESIIALIWAAIAMAFFGGVEGLNTELYTNGKAAAVLVDVIANETLGKWIAYLVMFGVVGAAITSGDTAFRSARLMIADAFGIEQRTLWKRVAVCLPIFALALFIILATDSQTLWRYFAWFNQTLSVFTLWAICIFLVRRGKPVVIAMLPAIWMTYICSSFLFTGQQMLHLSPVLGNILAGVFTLLITLYFIYVFNSEARNAKTQA